MVAAATRHDRTGLDRGHAREGAQPNALGAAGDLESLLARLRMSAEVLADMDRPAPGPLRDPQRLLDRVAPADEQPGAALAQSPVEIAQAVEQVGDTIRRPAGARQQSIVEHEQRQDAVGLPGGGGQGRLVADAQVSSEEDEDAAQFTLDKPGTRLELVTPSLPWKCSTN